MPELTDLKGVRRKTVPGKMVRSVTAALTATRQLATVAANDNGSIAVWITDAGNYRAEFCRRWIVRGEIETTSKTALREWLREYWPRMTEPS